MGARPQMGATNGIHRKSSRTAKATNLELEF
jgi:hypothetical protein